MDRQISIENSEYWWGGCVNLGHEMPYTRDSDAEFDLLGGSENDQFAPVMVSSKGRYIWSDGCFSVKIKNGIMNFCGSDKFELGEGYENLRGAYLAVMQRHFPFTGSMPDELFWRMPQYNTWIGLGTDQTTEKILAYAKEIIENGLLPGVLMIDGGWQEDYGILEFHRGKIPDPKYLINQLHNMGFKVMLWVSPIVSSAGTRFKMLRDKGYLIRQRDGEVAVRKWWSGYSAVLDFTNPEAVKWFWSELDSLTDRYEVDGFKFDAGDKYFYEDDDIIFKPTPAREQTAAFNAVGERYCFNEFRAAWKFGGRAIVARLHDKYHTWNDFGINTLIPHTILQGLCGYAYCCPDMVGGGILDCFNKEQKLDGELFVRWAQANALMGMMQISQLPWRALSPEHSELVKAAVRLHEDFSDVFLKLARNAAETGEPIIRHMTYVFPDEGFETISDQFMLGNDILAAPVITPKTVKRSVKLPRGKWKDDRGTVFDGGVTVSEDTPLDRILYFTKL